MAVDLAWAWWAWGPAGLAAIRPLLFSLDPGVKTSLSTQHPYFNTPPYHPPPAPHRAAGRASLPAWSFPRGEEEEGEEEGSEGREEQRGTILSGPHDAPAPRAVGEGSFEPGRVQICPSTSGGH